MDIKSKVQAFIESNQLFCKSEKLLLGLSGGADSVSMLLMLQSLGYDVGCVHCNFHLRGSESDRDETFVRELCFRRGVELDVVDFDTLGYCSAHGVSVEMGARTLRYDYFFKLMQDKGYDKVCVAHHRDDQIETFFINLLRGSGLRGLCGIPVKNGKVVRPLLCCSRDEILEYLQKEGVSYVTDSSNESTEYMRNKVRLELIPILERFNMSSKKNIETTISNLQEEKQIYDWCICRMEEEVSFVREGMLYISKEGIERSPSPLSLLHEVLRECGFHRDQLVQMLSSIDKVGRRFYSGQYVVTIDREYLVVCGKEESDMESVSMVLDGNEGELPLPNGQSLKYKTVKSDSLEINKSPEYAYFDKQKLSNPLIIRKVKAGDTLKPFGMRGKKLVNDLLAEKKLNRIDKDRQMLLESDGEIAWVIGVRSSEDFKVDERSVDVVELIVS